MEPASLLDHWFINFWVLGCSVLLSQEHRSYGQWILSNVPKDDRLQGTGGPEGSPGIRRCWGWRDSEGKKGTNSPKSNSGVVMASNKIHWRQPRSCLCRKQARGSSQPERLAGGQLASQKEEDEI